MIVKYIGERDTVALDREKEYDVLSVERGWFRIMTELDDDYLFPPDVFEIVDASHVPAETWHKDELGNWKKKQA